MKKKSRPCLHEDSTTTTSSCEPALLGFAFSCCLAATAWASTLGVSKHSQDLIISRSRCLAQPPGRQMQSGWLASTRVVVHCPRVAALFGCRKRDELDWRMMIGGLDHSKGLCSDARDGLRGNSYAMPRVCGPPCFPEPRLSRPSLIDTEEPSGPLSL